MSVEGFSNSPNRVKPKSCDIKISKCIFLAKNSMVLVVRLTCPIKVLKSYKTEAAFKDQMAKWSLV